jgi:starch phosphorylase
VGRVTLYLLDTNIPENPPHFQQVTARLYGGGLEMRIWQEMLIGIGGIKALRALGLAPKVIHMNEGHSAFAGLERIRLFMTEHNLPFEAAMELVASSSVFTTHTPVPAGNDRFPPDMMHRYFEPYARDMGLAFKVLLALGREDPRDDAEPFCMTVLALRLSRFNNGVSTLHGFVSRNMWKRVWPSYPVDDVPIGSITNGVHVPTWVARDMAQLYDRYLGPNWREDPDCTHAWGKAEDISDNELWRTHERLRARLVDFVRARLKRQMQAKGARRRALEIAEEALDPTALTIGFARRFATYKRAGLLLRDKERLRRLLTDEKRPVQLLIAGKAHPADNEGKKLIQELIQFCRAEDVRHRMIFLEDYDIRLAQAMLQGCDIWLNVPRRPLEACGTSGMKALVNGVLNLSIPDGWWDEAWRPDTSVGWAIGRGEEYDDHEYQDFVESQTLFNLLENEVVPDFYERSHGNLPRAWVRRMKRAISDLVPRYNSHRMVEDYVATAYVPAVENYNRLIRDDFMPSKEMASWRMEMMTRWSSLAVRDIRAQAEEKLHVGEPVEVGCQVHLGGIRPQDVKVELYAGPLDNQGQFASRHTAPMQAGEALEDGWHAFTGHIQPRDSGRFGFTVRIVPNHPLLLDPRSLGLIHWAQE